MRVDWIGTNRYWKECGIYLGTRSEHASYGAKVTPTARVCLSVIGNGEN